MWRAVGICIIVIACLSSCTKDTAVYSPCPGCPSNISFSAAIIPIFASNCSSVGCHNTSTHAGSVDLDSAYAYAAITKPGTGYVVAGNADYSLVYSELLPGNSLHMPISSQLDACDIQKIQCWINQGALNN